MKNKKKMLRNMLLFIVLIWLTFHLIFKDQNMDEMLEVLSGVNKIYLLIAVLLMCIYFLCEAINIRRTLKALGENISIFKNIKYALIGFFFSAVTPAASGGQPMEIYYMHKDGISVAKSTLALLINLSSMQIVTISVGLLSLFFNNSYMNTVLINCFVLGILLNASALAILLISIFSRRMTKGIINFVVKILKLFRVKNIEEKQEKLENELAKYQSSSAYIKANKKVILKTVFTTYIQYFAYYSVAYCIYLAFGRKGNNILEIASMQAVLFATVSGIPSPGAVGVSEGGFLEIFRNIYNEEAIGGAMLLNRMVNFYLFVIISAVIVMIYTIKDKKERISVHENKEINTDEEIHITENDILMEGTEESKNLEDDNN